MNSKRLKLFRLCRPVLHFLLIIAVFRIAYRSRLWGDIMWKFFNETPRINRHELFIFSLISAWVFVIIWLIKNLYELNKQTWSYIQKLSKVRVYRFITSAFISYFGQWFIFNFWISRYIILISAIMAYVILFFFDQIWYHLDFKLQKKSWNKVLIISDNLNKSSELLDKLKWNFSFPTEAIVSEDVDSVDLSEYSIAVVVGNVKQEVLQNILGSHLTILIHRRHRGVIRAVGEMTVGSLGAAHTGGCLTDVHHEVGGIDVKWHAHGVCIAHTADQHQGGQHS